MPISHLNPKRNLARKIVRNLKALPQREISTELGISQPGVSYGLKKGFEKELMRMLTLLELADYQVVEKEEIHI